VHLKEREDGGLQTKIRKGGKKIVSSHCPSSFGEKEEGQMQ